MGTPIDPKQSDEGMKFLERDFNQCFEQMRQYDLQIIDLGKFAFTAYPVVVGAAVGIYKYGLDKGVDYSKVAGMIPLIAFFPGFFLLWHMVRTHVYAVRVTRYVNEHRSVFLALNPSFFPNMSGMYINPEEPPYYSPYSSQLYFMCILAILNAFLLGVAAYLFTVHWTRQWTSVVIFFLGPLAIQLGLMIYHLDTQE